MVSVNDKKITMTRGDTLRLGVRIMIDGAEYTPVDGDAIRFALKSNKLNAAQSAYADRVPLIKKDIPNSSMTFTLTPDDTHGLGFGLYDYDIQITFRDGTVDTFITGVLELTKEVD